jgi:hypothetical protein
VIYAVAAWIARALEMNWRNIDWRKGFKRLFLLATVVLIAWVTIWFNTNDGNFMLNVSRYRAAQSLADRYEAYKAPLNQPGDDIGTMIANARNSTPPYTEDDIAFLRSLPQWKKSSLLEVRPAAAGAEVLRSWADDYRRAAILNFSVTFGIPLAAYALLFWIIPALASWLAKGFQADGS